MHVILILQIYRQEYKNWPNPLQIVFLCFLKNQLLWCHLIAPTKQLRMHIHQLSLLWVHSECILELNTFKKKKERQWKFNSRTLCKWLVKILNQICFLKVYFINCSCKRSHCQHESRVFGQYKLIVSLSLTRRLLRV